jgi:hypothetical protein
VGEKISLEASVSSQKCSFALELTIIYTNCLTFYTLSSSKGFLFIAPKSLSEEKFECPVMGK